jgi:hypothetical protein
VGRVFLVQRPSITVNGRWVDKYSLDAATRFGDLVECLPPGNIPRDLSAAADALKAALGGFRRGEDYLLAIGDPIAISLAVLIADRVARGGIRMLKWDRRGGVYIPFTLEI